MTNKEFKVQNGTITGYEGDGGVLNIPKGVTSIGYASMRWRREITGVHLPVGVESIQIEAFCGCDRLTEINLPGSLKSLGGNSLRYTAISELVIPDGVTDIAYAALNGCRNLKKLVLPKSLTKISDRLLCDCENLREIVIPDGVSYVGREAFARSGIECVVIPDGVTHICADAFQCCTNLTVVEIPDSVSHIGRNVFRKCTNLTIRVSAGSYAEKYGKENGIPVVVQ